MSAGDLRPGSGKASKFRELVERYRRDFPALKLVDVLGLTVEQRVRLRDDFSIPRRGAYLLTLESLLRGFPDLATDAGLGNSLNQAVPALVRWARNVLVPAIEGAAGDRAAAIKEIWSDFEARRRAAAKVRDDQANEVFLRFGRASVMAQSLSENWRRYERQGRLADKPALIEEGLRAFLVALTDNKWPLKSKEGRAKLVHGMLATGVLALRDMMLGGSGERKRLAASRPDKLPKQLAARETEAWTSRLISVDVLGCVAEAISERAAAKTKSKAVRAVRLHLLELLQGSGGLTRSRLAKKYHVDEADVSRAYEAELVALNRNSMLVSKLKEIGFL